MTHDQLFVFRNLLHGLMDQIRNKDKATAEAISEVYQACPDLNDRATLEAERTMLILLGQRERSLLQQIREALSRIDEGSYGICQECGDSIPRKRLEFQPTSTLCVHCQQDQEQEAAMNGFSWA
ncbi:TraR/DksA family transcriptional regulator [Desulfonatronum thioautotrophicum]|uniref:TraR/DksA family transcriptional regulator n=1 Tax=Desulfonatronum thioautotrophicum TaxID=617001 RepID=UPI0005EBEB1B|nr:TraR/DksA C4-type zinc finger protein [Desulfonatronum thioautotrophicum]